MYYLRSRPAADPIKFTVDVESLLKTAGHIEIEHKKEQPLMRVTTLENLEDVPSKKMRTNDGEAKACPMRKKDAPADEECMACGS
jgi:ribonucleoside-diphosphate reductase subunit M1